MAKIQISLDLLQRFLASVNYHCDEATGAQNVMGIRAALPRAGSLEIETVPNQIDLYNDTLVAFGTPAGGQAACHAYRCSVDPGLFYTEHPMQKGGCAHLINGQYRYKVGLHKGHTALVQGEHVSVWRDENRNFVRDGRDFVETGEFGIHIHAGGTTQRVGRYSAGCSVIWGGWRGRTWTEFIHLMTSRHQDRFWYTLIDATDLVNFALAGVDQDPESPALPVAKRQALQQVLGGIATLYAYEKPAELGEQSGVSFLHLLNRLRQTGVLRNLKAADPPPSAPVDGPRAAREALIGGFRVIYAHLLDSGLDQPFHSQLNQLRHFGPLGAM
jgi:hypothetical protein